MAVVPSIEESPEITTRTPMSVVKTNNSTINYMHVGPEVVLVRNSQCCNEVCLRPLVLHIRHVRRHLGLRDRLGESTLVTATEYHKGRAEELTILLFGPYLVWSSVPRLKYESLQPLEG